ncbi:PspC domain-containing protein [Puerhibacterium sp. TATVAM-FAB25]|uniref:PspC domain-containing protein n=1 Tax=Puerhibacterium sp. TATVAM-FAB25 TaxID=3093699 RepID=UPI003978D472
MEPTASTPAPDPRYPGPSGAPYPGAPSSGQPYPQQPPSGRRTFFRPARGRMLGGVCAGVADYFGWDRTAVRLLTVASLLLPGPQVLAYLVLWVLVPDEHKAAARAAHEQAGYTGPYPAPSPGPSPTPPAA